MHVGGAPWQPSPVILSPDRAEGQAEPAFEDFTDLTFGSEYKRTKVATILRKVKQQRQLSHPIKCPKKILTQVQ